MQPATLDLGAPVIWSAAVAPPTAAPMDPAPPAPLTPYQALGALDGIWTLIDNHHAVHRSCTPECDVFARLWTRAAEILAGAR